MSDPFRLPPEGILSEQIDLPDHRLSLGLIHPDGCGVRVARWNGEDLGHMSPAKARRFAAEMSASVHALELLPAIRALEKLAARADELAGSLAGMVVEGHA